MMGTSSEDFLYNPSKMGSGISLLAWIEIQEISKTT